MEADAIVLDTVEHGESDLIVTFFSQETGRLSAIAKGAKRSKKRFVNKLEIFTFLQILYTQKTNSGLAFLNEAELNTSFPRLRTNFTLYGAASVIREFLLLGIREGEPEPGLFHLTLWALDSLDRQQPPKTIVTLFLIRYLGLIGYRPNFDSCGICDKVITPQTSYSFDNGAGHLVCPGCSGQRGYGMVVSTGTIKLLGTAQNLPLNRLHRIKISGTILRESLALLHSFGRQIFQRDIISWKTLGLT